MNKHFKRQGEFPSPLSTRPLTHFLDFLERAFARQNNQIASECPSELHSSGARNGHLRRNVYRKIGRKLTNQAAYSDVLDNCGIHSRSYDGPEVLFGLRHLILEYERIECHIALHAAAVEEFHQLR